MEPETVTSLAIAFGALFLFLLVGFILDRKTAFLAAAIPDDLRIKYGIVSESKKKPVKSMIFTMGGLILSGIDRVDPTLQITLRMLGVAMVIFGVGVLIKAPVKMLCSSAELHPSLKTYSRWALALHSLLCIALGFSFFLKISR